MSEAATANDVVDTLLSVHKGNQLVLEAEGYEWASPFEVTEVDEVLFEAPNGGVWKARRVTLASTAKRGSDREFDVYPAAPAPNVGPGYGRLVNANLVDEDTGTSTEDTPTSDIDSESEAETDVLEEDAADDAPADAGDDVQDEIDAEEVTVDAVGDEETFECDCGQTFESQQALQGHGPNSCEGGDDESVALPDGVTEDDVDELTSGGIEIGDLAEELDVHRNEARLIAHQLGFYKRVREVWRDRERAQLDPRLGGLLVVALGLVTIGLLAVGVTLQ
ncbi:C2H2-type zinc finger protein [Natrinema thermotolerans]|uniref:C2H2-type zinc finger protein n=1 Tax=Natrinema thermotolerans TaxID=121872 RepID=A0AAF0PFV4_9EURY|nr:C2H2-type zinc finger protein [Natrinema thermotolerans]WPH65882.1 C2H2-type zinc finger protein [Haloarchaeal virus HJTV-4]QCC60786.1 C2H2-type zinc finger protein [Natrinema thermotolerans]QCC61665.1 C2H2-type zinc finger protein [Natrinema thermotolerans]WMT07833.1 C2H2-type zinc finger protein [Natrinema thermotolerans]WMT08465.1 C2H2-type zinc finger protein [Natrinema thermotolerans]